MPKKIFFPRAFRAEENSISRNQGVMGVIQKGMLWKKLEKLPKMSVLSILNSKLWKNRKKLWKSQSYRKKLIQYNVIFKYSSFWCDLTSFDTHNAWKKLFPRPFRVSSASLPRGKKPKPFIQHINRFQMTSATPIFRSISSPPSHSPWRLRNSESSAEQQGRRERACLRKLFPSGRL